MRRVKYTGDSCSLGGHGWVKKGQELFLTEDEFKTTHNDDRFSEVEPLLLKDTPDVFPAKTKSYDLTRFRWDSPRLGQRLRKLTMGNLLKVVDGIRELGVDFDDIDDGRLYLADQIQQFAEVEGWTRFTRVELSKMAESAKVRT